MNTVNRIIMFKEELAFETEKELIPITQEELTETYYIIINILKQFVCMQEEYYSIIALWIIGTYSHKQFVTYPYIYINAMKGSGKTRLLKLIAALSYKGSLLSSVTESVMFRTASDGTMCIDEFEHIASKEKNTLRDLLNSAYKKGLTVKRMRKKKVDGEETQVVEEFEVFCPIAIANISGMEDILGDRCINIILEKTNKPITTKLIENFSDNEEINVVKCSIAGKIAKKYLHNYTHWNDFIKSKYTIPIQTTTLYTQHYTHTLTTLNDTKRHEELTEEEKIMFELIDNANIDGRYLEQYFSIFTIANSISVEELIKTIDIAKMLIEERKVEEVTENKDILLVEYIAQLIDTKNFIEIREIMSGFKEYLKEESEDIKWINSRWIGKALTRLKFAKKKRRLGKGVEVIIDIEKAIRRYEIFKPKQEVTDKQTELQTTFEQTETTHLKCSLCGASPCEYKSDKGEPICKQCAIPEEEVR